MALTYYIRIDGTTLQAHFSGTSAGDVTMNYTSSGIEVQ